MSAIVKVVIVLVVVVVVVSVMVVAVGMLLVVGGVVDNRRATTTTTNTTHTIPQPSIQRDKFFLNISVTLKTAITTTTILPLPSIPY